MKDGPFIERETGVASAVGVCSRFSGPTLMQVGAPAEPADPFPRAERGGPGDVIHPGWWTGGPWPIWVEFRASASGPIKPVPG